MAFLGNQTTPSTGFNFDDFGDCQFWVGFTMPAGGGTITDMWLYVAGDGANDTIQFVIWGGGNANNVLWNSSNYTTNSGSRSIGGQRWEHVTVPNVFQPAGNINLGFWTQGNVVWTYEGSGNTLFMRSVLSPSHISSPGTENGNALGVYVQYNPGSPGGVAVPDPGGGFSRHPLTTLDPDGTFHKRPVLTLDPDGTWHKRA